MSRNSTTGKILYGVSFCLFIPLLLVAWTALLEKNLQQNAFSFPGDAHEGIRIAGIIFLLSGICILLAGMYALSRFGKGLPMNAYPPEHYVKRGVYFLFRHPIYVGFCLVSLGISCMTLSFTGVYIITPVVIAGCFAIVYGYEQSAIENHFGPQQHVPLIGFFHGPDRSLSFFAKCCAAIMVFIPWLIIYEMALFAGPGETWISTALTADQFIPTWPAAVYAYSATYIFVVITPFTIKRSFQMRAFVIDGILATLIGGFLFLIFPFYYEGKTIPAHDFTTVLIGLERSLDGTSAALPSFHVIWALLAAFHFRVTHSSLKIITWLLAIAIVCSCLLTGIHSLFDVAAGIGVVIVIRMRKIIWSWMNRITERLANSWTEWHVGQLRIISHSVYAGLAGIAGVLIVGQFIPGIHVIIIIGCASLAGAALWGQFIEGSARMLRPFGYYGSITGGIIGVLVALQFTSLTFFQLMAALALAAPFVQAIGRLRCLVQGCCHGKRTHTAWGICVSHPASRVSATAELRGQRIHNTQLYSILFNVIIAGVLWRMYFSHVPSSVLAGMYFILSGCARFIEEHYRGEPQTKIKWGLRMYQWTAIVSVIAGIIITCIPSPTEIPMHFRADAALLATAMGSGIVFAFAMGMDFPKSTRRFSRLTG